MPLPHRDLISSTSQPYFGMRDTTRVARGRGLAARPKYTMTQIREAINRTPQSWTVWTAYQRPKGGWKGTPCRCQPSYLSAYMMLLDGVHPYYELHGFIPNRGKTRFPAIPKVSDEYAAEWRSERGITHEEVSDVFDYQKAEAPDTHMFNKARFLRKVAKKYVEGDENPNIRQHSVRRIGADGVRWLMLQLMADAHPTLQLSRRAEPVPEILAPPAHQE